MYNLSGRKRLGLNPSALKIGLEDSVRCVFGVEVQ